MRTTAWEFGVVGRRGTIAVIAAVLLLAGLVSCHASTDRTAPTAPKPTNASKAPPSPPKATRGAGTPTTSDKPVAEPWYLPDTKKRMLLGAYVEVKGHSSSEPVIEQQEDDMGRRYDLEITYYDWRDPFPDFGEQTIAAHGRTPVMSWYGPGKDDSDHHTVDEILDGSQDSWILRQARAIKAFSRPIYLRLMPEMNGNWYHGYGGMPTKFIAAWRHVHDLFEKVGAHNVLWVWCPNAEPKNWDQYYPGDAYVDVIGVDGYNNGATRAWRSFEQIFDEFFRHYAGKKPLMVDETATNSDGGDAGAWINDMHTYLKDVAGPRYGVIGICWFDTNTSDDHDWRFNQTPDAWQAWLAMARDPYFGGSG